MTNPTGRGNTNPSFNDQQVLSSRNLISSMLGAAAGNANTEISPEVLRLLLSYVQTAGSVGQAGGNRIPAIISGNQLITHPPVVTQQPMPMSSGGGGLAAGLNAFENATQSFSTLATALSNLISSTMPQQSQGGASNQSLAANAAMTISGLIYSAATSKAARKTGIFCYQECSDKCAGNCGCPGCGCANGECGCGKFGSCFCRWWGMICGADKHDELRQKLEELEARYGKAVILMALSNLNINVVDVLSGQGRINLPPIDEIESACSLVSTQFVDILQHESESAWLCAFVNSGEVLSIPFWRECIVRALVDPSCDLDENLLTDKVMVTTPLSESMLVCAPFELVKVAHALPRIKVTSDQEDTPRNLGVMQVANMIQLVAKIFANATGGGERPVWLSKEQLMSIISVVLVQSGYHLVSRDQEGLPIYQEMKLLMEEVCQKKLQKAQSSMETDPRDKKRMVEDKFVSIANMCCKQEKRRATVLQDPNNVSERDELILRMSQSWLAAAGIRPSPSRAGTPAASLLATPRRSPPSTPVGGNQQSEATVISQQPPSGGSPSNAETSSTGSTGGSGGGIVSLALKRMCWTDAGHHNQSFDEEDC
ncbi:hypothetical protein [Chlamydia pecorum]|uniref:hypothetical protein n=1 Tax=Chlamydia pecorum TaxID=85991 RepID=UPI0003D3C4B8|nr:hypothetical protein [Chlamydia pecorum]ETF37448.1 hypothetical protein CpecS_0642 [Chlamydia pecorum VR629]